MELTKFNLFIKLMGMTTSSSDGECLTAIRKANNLLAEANNNWEDLLRNKVKVIGGSVQTSSPGPAAKGKIYTNEVEIEHMIETMLRHLPSGSSFRAFVMSIQEWWEEKQFLTEKQYNALKKGYSNL